MEVSEYAETARKLSTAQLNEMLRLTKVIENGEAAEALTFDGGSEKS